MFRIYIVCFTANLFLYFLQRRDWLFLSQVCETVTKSPSQMSCAPQLCIWFMIFQYHKPILSFWHVFSTICLILFCSNGPTTHTHFLCDFYHFCISCIDCFSERGDFYFVKTCKDLPHKLPRNRALVCTAPWFFNVTNLRFFFNVTNFGTLTICSFWSVSFLENSVGIPLGVTKRRRPTRECLGLSPACSSSPSCLIFHVTSLFPLLLWSMSIFSVRR